MVSTVKFFIRKKETSRGELKLELSVFQIVAITFAFLMLVYATVTIASKAFFAAKREYNLRLFEEMKGERQRGS